MTYQRTLKLRLSHDEARAYMAPAGVTVRWLQWDFCTGTVVAQFSCDPDDTLFFETHQKGRDIIGFEIDNRFRGRVLQDLTKQYAAFSTITGRRDIIVDDAVLEQTPRGTRHRISEVHTTEKSLEETDALNKILGKKLYPLDKKDKGRTNVFEVGKLDDY